MDCVKQHALQGLYRFYTSHKKCEEFDFFPKNVRNLTFSSKMWGIRLFSKNVSKSEISWEISENVILNACQIFYAKRHVALCINLTPLNANRWVDLVYLAMVSQSFVYVQNSLFTFDSTQSVWLSHFHRDFQFRRFSLIYLTFHVWKEIRFKLSSEQ